MRHIIPISGKDSAATAIVQKTADPNKEYTLLFNDTEAELPEVYQWLDTVSVKLNLPLVKAGKSLEDLIYEQNFLPSYRSRFCTRMSKIYPMEDYIGKEEATVYYGIRADEERIGYVASKGKRIEPKYPLQEHNIDLAGVYAILEANNLLPPQFFWETLYNEVASQLTAQEVTLVQSLPLWVRGPLFAWRTRANCYFCFFQRRYEFVGLLEHHPKLFDKAQEIEEEVGGEKFYWLKDLPLRELREKADDIRKRRANKIIKIIRNAEKDDTDNWTLMNVVSCGLFCGK